MHLPAHVIFLPQRRHCHGLWGRTYYAVTIITYATIRFSRHHGNKVKDVVTWKKLGWMCQLQYLHYHRRRVTTMCIVLVVVIVIMGFIISSSQLQNHRQSTMYTVLVVVIVIMACIEIHYIVVTTPISSSLRLGSRHRNYSMHWDSLYLRHNSNIVINVLYCLGSRHRNYCMYWDSLYRCHNSNIVVNVLYTLTVLVVVIVIIACIMCIEIHYIVVTTPISSSMYYVHRLGSRHRNYCMYWDSLYRRHNSIIVVNVQGTLSWQSPSSWSYRDSLYRRHNSNIVVNVIVWVVTIIP